MYAQLIMCFNKRRELNGGITMANFNETITFPSGVTLPNRLMMAPMTTQLSFYNGVITED